MKTIYKYKIPLQDIFELEMQVNAKILCLQMQHNIPCIWAEVNPKSKTEKRKFILFGTGHPLPDNELNYIGTFQLAEGSFIGHLYEVKNDENNN